MLDKLFVHYLKLSGKEYLVPFLKGLSHLGRPATVLFPYELLEQGLAIILSGLNNTMAIQSSPHWVWPYWVERQINPDGAEFIPTAINLIKTNLTSRNWTSIGLPDSPRESMVDPVGMLTLRPYGWSVFPYLRIDGVNHFPPRMVDCARQSLLEGIFPCVITSYPVHPSLEWKSEARALKLGGEELILYSHSLRNRSRKTLSFRFGLAIRPYNPLMVGHINKIHFKNRLWRVNGRPGLLLTEDPTRVVLSDRHHGDPLLSEFRGTRHPFLRSSSGIACGIAEYDIELAPDAMRRIESLGIIEHIGPNPKSKFASLTAQGIEEAKSEQLKNWKTSKKNGLSLSFPDKNLEKAFYAVKNHMHVFDDGGHFSPGTFLYHNHWFRDSAYIALAFENIGWPDKVAPKLHRYFDSQTSQGFFKSQRGEWDSNGQALVTLVNHVKRGGDPDLLDAWYPRMVKGIKWIESMRDTTRKSRSPHAGLLPAGFSAEHFGPNDHYYWDNFWSIAGIQAVRWAALKIGRAEDALWLNGIIQDYSQDLGAAMNWAFERMGDQLLPSSPYRWMDSSAIGNLVAVSPLGVVPLQDPWVEKTVEFLIEHNMRDGLFFQKIVHTGLNPYLSVQLARVLLLLGDARWKDVLTSLIAKATPTYTWPEAMHPRMFGGCMGDGDHGWSAAEFLNLIRDMAVLERPNELWLGAGLFPEWYHSGTRIKISGARTFFGTVNYTLEQSVQGLQLDWSIKRLPHQDKVKAYFFLPEHSRLNSGTEALLQNKRYRILLHGDAGTMTFYSEDRIDSKIGIEFVEAVIPENNLERI